MYHRIKIYLIIGLFAMLGCQSEITEMSPPNDQVLILQDSSLARLLLNTSTLDGSLDNIIDNANCILINLPVNVEVNGVEIVVNSIEDYESIESIFDMFFTDTDSLEILFPITVTLSNHTEVEIANYEELVTLGTTCAGENVSDDDIECIDFQYPIKFSIYNTSFQVVETITINNDKELYLFINDLDNVTLASLSYPVTMILSDGSTIEVFNNEGLETEILEADGACDEDDDYDWNDDDCNQEAVEAALKTCVWNIVFYNGESGTMIEKDIEFLDDAEFQVTLDDVVVHEGTWIYTEIDGNIAVSFNTDWEYINGIWAIEDCQDDRLQFVIDNN